MFVFCSPGGITVEGKEHIYTDKLPKGMTMEVNGVLVIGLGTCEEKKESA